MTKTAPPWVHKQIRVHHVTRGRCWGHREVSPRNYGVWGTGDLMKWRVEVGSWWDLCEWIKRRCYWLKANLRKKDKIIAVYNTRKHIYFLEGTQNNQAAKR